MFGVNKEGHDVLAPQFKKGKQEKKGAHKEYAHVEAKHPRKSLGSVELDMAFETARSSILKNHDTLARFRHEAEVEVSKKMGVASLPDIQRLVDEKVDRLAMKYIDIGRDAEATAASRSGVLRTG